jgi:hypothetical protein
MGPRQWTKIRKGCLQSARSATASDAQRSPAQGYEPLPLHFATAASNIFTSQCLWVDVKIWGMIFRGGWSEVTPYSCITRMRVLKDSPEVSRVRAIEMDHFFSD